MPASHPCAALKAPSGGREGVSRLPNNSVRRPQVLSTELPKVLWVYFPKRVNALGCPAASVQRVSLSSGEKRTGVQAKRSLCPPPFLGCAHTHGHTPRGRSPWPPRQHEAHESEARRKGELTACRTGIHSGAQITSCTV